MVGKRAWEAARLSASVQHNWAIFEADLLLTTGREAFGLLAEIRFARFLNVFYHWLTRNLDERKKMTIDAAIETPPPWADPEDISEESKADDAAAFRSAMSRSGNGIRTSM